MTHDVAIGSLFSGIGGLDLGLECALRDGGFNVSTVWQCEADAWCRSILARHWPRAVQYDDVRAVGPDAPRVDVLCGGFPCQDVSYAGKGAGLAGERSGLWFEFARLVRDLRPRIVVVENVAALATRGLDAVLGSLSEAGYDALWFDLRAADVGAPHRRERLFIVGWQRELEHADGGGCGACGVARMGGTMGDGRVTADDAAASTDASPDELADAQGVRRDPRGLSIRETAQDTVSPLASENYQLADAGGLQSVQRHDADVLRRRTEKAQQARLGGRSRRGTSAHSDGCVNDDGRLAQPGLRRGVDGLPEGLDTHQWPSRPGEAQRADEAPRVTTETHERAKRLKALGNAVVPQCGYVVGCVVAEVLRGGIR